MATSSGAVQLDLVAGSTRNFQASAEAAIGKATKSLTASLKAMTVVAIGVGFGKFIEGCVSVAAYSQQTANRVNTIFPTMSKAVNDFTSDAMYSMGMTSGSAKRLMSSFGMVSQSMGLTEGQAVSMSSQLTTLAGDMAAFYGISTDDAQSKLMGIFTGQTSGLKMLGVNMSEANLQAHALSLGIQKEISAMTDAEIATIRMSFAQQQLSKIHGYAARNLETWVGQTGLLNQQFKVLQSNLGKVAIASLLPIIKLLNTLVARLVDASRAFVQLIETMTGKKLADVVGIQGGVVNDLADISDEAADSTADLAAAQSEAEKAAKAQEKAQKALNRTLAGFDKINKLSSNSDSLGTTAGAATLTAPSLDMGQFYGEIEQANKALASIAVPESVLQALEKLSGAFERIKTVIGGALGKLWEDVVVPIGNWTINELLPQVLMLVANAFETLAIVLDKLAPVAEFIWDEFLRPLGEFVAGAIGSAIIGFLDAVNSGWSAINDVADQADFTPLLDALKEFKNTDPAAFDLIAGAIAGIALALSGHPIIAALMGIATVAKVIYENWDGIVAFFQGVWDGICKAFGNVKEWFKQKFEGARDAIHTAFSNIKQWFTDRYNDIVNTFKNIHTWFGDKFAAAKKAITDKFTGIKQWFTDRYNEVTGAFKNAHTWFGDKFNAAKKAVTDKFGAIKQWFTDTRQNIYERIKGVVTGIPKFFDDARKGAINKFNGIRQWFTDTRQNIYERIKGVVTGIPKFFDDARKGAINKFNGIRQWFTDTRQNIYSRISGIPNWFKDTFNNAKNKAQDAFKNLPNFFGNIWKSIKNKFSSLGTSVGNAIGGAAKSGINKVISGAQSAINAGIGLINKAIGLINKLPGVNVRSVGYVSFPRLAEGGFVQKNTPRLAVIGDNTRYGEIVSPENKLQAMADTAARNAVQAAPGGADITPVITLLEQLIQAVQSQDKRTYLDGRDITRYVVNAVNQQTQATGRCPITI